MSAQHRAELFRAASKYLASLGCGRGEFTIELTCDGETHRLACRVWPDAKADGDWLVFSPLEEKIIDALRGRGWVTTTQLAAELHEDPTGDLRAVLRNLQEKNVVEITQKQGVKLNEAAQAAG